jgi:tetratricopeptide (TPR) repeat protein
VKNLRVWSLLVLFATAIYVYAWPTATIHYYVFVMLHVLAGLVLLASLFRHFIKLWQGWSRIDRAGWCLVTLGGIIGVALIFIGTLRKDLPLLDAHIAGCTLGGVLLVGNWLHRRSAPARRFLPAAIRWAAVLVAVAFVCYGAWWVRTVEWQRQFRIANPAIAPASMAEEGSGAAGPFFPSSARVLDNVQVPKEFFLQSESCRSCHADIYKEWQSSAHHFSSFNNQWYRKSVEYMQDTVGIQPSKWCAGCHDPALLLTGMFDRPVREIENTPEGQAGLACVMCHSIEAVPSTMGQGGYVLEYPPIDRLASSKNPLIHGFVDFLTKLNPEPHRRAFLKPFVRQQTAQFCSTCHKVHLDGPVNHYRWIRGFNEYDNWQASGVSGQGARSFYYPPKPMTCSDCHMPRTASNDLGNIAGYVDSHRFPAANTALPYENEDDAQLDAVEKFLKANQVSVDIFGVLPEPEKQRDANAGLPLPSGLVPQIQTSFGVGEESAFTAPQAPGNFVSPAAQLSAPFGRVPIQVRRGDTVEVEVVVRTRNVGHFFPGGTVDAYDLWLELQAQDDKGRVIFWSGKAGPNGDGNGPVDPGAQFYRSLQIDAHGNPIDRRNAWAARSVVYVHLIPPGAADTVHYRLQIPKDAGDKIRLTAKLNYRKFAWYFTRFAFGAALDPGQPNSAFAPGYDDRNWLLTGSPAGHSGKREGVPNLPIVVMGQSTAELTLIPANAEAPRPRVDAREEDWQRWNDYGIGLLLQGDLQGADAAFQKVADAAPDRGDGWVNMGRARFQEGNLPAAQEVLLHALKVAPNLASAHYFYGSVLRSQGKYNDAIAQFRVALAQYPTDRVVRNDVGRTLFLQRRYSDAIREFEAVLAIDPEDLEANYNLMLCYNGLGQANRAKDYQTRYLRFKANEAEQAITGDYLRAHPADNLERQPIHEVSSAPLAPSVQPMRESAAIKGAQ